MLLYKLLWIIFNYIPFPIWKAIAYVVSRVLVLVLKRDREIAIAQLDFVLKSDNSKLNSLTILKNAYLNSIFTIIELFRITKITKISKLSIIDKPQLKSELGLIKAEGIENAQEMIDNQTGAICLGSHLSNFDLMTSFFTLQGLKLYIVARSANSKILHETLLKIRASYGTEVLWREEKKSTTTLLKILKNNGIICSLIDQDVDLENQFSDFFGLPAAHPIGLIRLAVRFKKPVLLVYILRNGDQTYQLGLSRIHWEGKENPEQFILDSYSRWLEDLIKLAPEQWVWWHRRWRRRPEIDYKVNPEKLIRTKDYVSWIKEQTRLRLERPSS